VTIKGGRLRAPRHDIEKVVRQHIPNAARARTAAECLFWLERTGHQIEGKPAIYKTGEDLSREVGWRPRTCNAHVKDLAKLGLFDLRYLPRPGRRCPSPVTWMVATDLSNALLHEAALLSSNGARRTAQRPNAGPAKDSGSDVQMSVPQTLQFSSPELQPANSPDNSAGNCLRAKSKANAKGKQQASQVPLEDRYPEDVVKWAQQVQQTLLHQSLDLWQLESKFTYEHSATFLDAVDAVPELDRDSVHSLLLEAWPSILPQLPFIYRDYVPNVARPTPRVLGDQAALIAALLRQRVISKAKKEAVGFANGLDDF
jgi:hypothetical protein